MVANETSQHFSTTQRLKTRQKQQTKQQQFVFTKSTNMNQI